MSPAVAGVVGIPAWIPLIDPLYSIVPHLTSYWLLFAFPLVLIISLVYQTVRRRDLTGLRKATLWLAIKIILGMALICVVVQVVYHLAVHYSTAPL